jgi:hypothetical protein
MARNWLFLVVLFLFSCNRIETGDSLHPSDIAYIKKLNLLDSDETIYKFYSEARIKAAGNFFTNKRMAKYWIDDFNSEKDEVNFAYYPDIKSIDTVYYAGLTWCPYMLVTKTDGSKFKVCVEGRHEQIKSFFEDALKLWRQNNGRAAIPGSPPY